MGLFKNLKDEAMAGNRDAMRALARHYRKRGDKRQAAEWVAMADMAVCDYCGEVECECELIEYMMALYLESEDFVNDEALIAGAVK